MGDVSLKIKNGDYVNEYRNGDFAIAGMFQKVEDEMPNLFVDIRGDVTASQFRGVISEMYKGVLMAIPEDAVPKFMSAMHEATKYVEALFNTKLEVTLVKKDNADGGD